MRVSSVVWGTEGTSVPCFCTMRFYHRLNHHMNAYLNHFISLNAIVSVLLGEWALVIQRYRTAQFSLSFLPAAVRL